jgi:hypothetical protein
VDVGLLCTEVGYCVVLETIGVSEPTGCVYDNGGWVNDRGEKENEDLDEVEVEVEVEVEDEDEDEDGDLGETGAIDKDEGDARDTSRGSGAAGGALV